jgi:hypothetical protein
MTGVEPSEDGDDLAYVYKPSLLGAPWQFRLRRDALEWQMGRHQGRTPYRNIARVRLSYRPQSMQMRRFMTEIWTAEGVRLSIASSSWRTMVEMERLDAAYGDFIHELHRRMMAEGTRAKFETGSPVLLYWPGLAIVAAGTFAITVLLANALRFGDWKGAAILAGFLALFAWQGGTFFYRNRPGPYRPDAVPPQVLP